MGDEDGKWIRFEDGLLEGGAVSNNELTHNNRISYKNFRKQCVDQKSAEERRAILIFLGVNLGKEKASKRNKNEHVDKGENPIRKLLLESIMKSCTINRVDDRKFLTVSVVRCEDSDIKNAAHMTEHEKEVANKINCAEVDSVKEVLDNGGRIVNGKKISWWKRVVLSRKYIQNILNNIIFKYSKKWMVILNTILCVSIIKLILNKTIEYIEQILLKTGISTILMIDVMYKTVCKYGQETMRETIEHITDEVKCYRNLNYPIIFYNETGKTKGWMKNYIQRYLNEEKGVETKKPIFYIGAGDFGGVNKNANFYQFTIPTGHPEWGLICLCQLIRDLADNPWGEIKLKTSVEKRMDINPILESEMKEEENHIKIFRMPEDEYSLWYQIEMKKKKYWNYARIYGSIHENEKAISSLFPISNSVYVIYKNKNVNEDEFFREVIDIQDIFLRILGIAQISVELQYWFIVQGAVAQEIIEILDAILNQSALNGRHPLWGNIWKYIVGLLIEIENQDNFIIMKKLCDKVWIRRAFQDQPTFDEFYSIEYEKRTLNVRKREMQL